jgi:hypothetical protein
MMNVTGWRTTKTTSGYMAEVYTYEANGARAVLKYTTFPTRAQAMGYAKKWVLYFRRMAKAA